MGVPGPTWVNWRFFSSLSMSLLAYGLFGGWMNRGGVSPGLSGERIGRALGQIEGVTDPFAGQRSEEHTSELQSLMRISYAVFCLTKQKLAHKTTNHQTFAYLHHSTYEHSTNNNTH